MAGTRPSREREEKGFVARPIYYGMLLFAQAGAGQLVGSKLDQRDQAPLLTAYAIRNDAGGMKVPAFNKSATRSVSLTIDAGQRAQRVRSLRRHAPRVDDPTDATFGGGPGVLRRRMVGVEGRSIDGRKRSGGSLISPLQARPCSHLSANDPYQSRRSGAFLMFPDGRSRRFVKLWSLVGSTTKARIVDIPSIMNVLDFGGV